MQILIRYEVKEQHVEEHLGLLRQVFRELQEAAIPGFGYAAYQLEDGVTFVELLDSEEGPAPLAAAPTFARYRATLDARCTTPPAMTELREVASVGLRTAPVSPRQAPPRDR